jgi:hypothetical protein
MPVGKLLQDGYCGIISSPRKYQALKTINFEAYGKSAIPSQDSAFIRLAGQVKL